MTTDEILPLLQGIRDEIRQEREARIRENDEHDKCMSEMSRVLVGIEAALVGSVHTREKGMRETVNTHETRLDDHLARLITLEKSEHPCQRLLPEDIQKLKDMPSAAEVRQGLSHIEKIMIYVGVLGTLGSLLLHFFKK